MENQKVGSEPNRQPSPENQYQHPPYPYPNYGPPPVPYFAYQPPQYQEIILPLNLTNEIKDQLKSMIQKLRVIGIILIVAGVFDIFGIISSLVMESIGGFFVYLILGAFDLTFGILNVINYLRYPSIEKATGMNLAFLICGIILNIFYAFICVSIIYLLASGEYYYQFYDYHYDYNYTFIIIVLVMVAIAFILKFILLIYGMIFYKKYENLCREGNIASRYRVVV